MIAGFVSIYFGYKLFIKGIDGSATMEGEVRKIKLSLRNAAPGLFFALFGTFVVMLGIYKKDIYSEKITNEGKQTYISKGSNISDLIDINREQIENDAFNLAVQLKKNNEANVAKYLYLLLILSNQNNHNAHNNLANILLEEGSYEAALSHIKYAINICLDDVTRSYYYDTLARIYTKQNKIEEAMKAIATAIQLNPGDKELRIFLSDLESKLK